MHRVSVSSPPFLNDPKTVGVIGAPMAFGQPFAGTDRGPSSLRAAGLNFALAKLGWRLEETGDVGCSGDTASAPADLPQYSGPGMAKNSARVARGCGLLANRVREQVDSGNFALVLGGDHSIALGSVAGVLQARPDTG